jgi:hypothetical protein
MMAALALTLYLLGLVLAFGWRSLSQWRSTPQVGVQTAR